MRNLETNRMTVLLLCLLTGLVLLACQPGKIVPPTIPTLEPTATLQPTPALSPSRLKTLLAFIPQGWADIHAPAGFGPAIYLFDFAQMRADQGVPPVTGADNREAKQALVRSLNLQNLEFDIPGQDLSGASFEEWGWDLADVAQALYLPDLDTAILLGDFSRPEVRQRLMERGYVQSKRGDFTVFTAEKPPVKIAWKPDTLIVVLSQTTGDLLETLIQQSMEQKPGLQSHPSVAPIMEEIGGPWGVVLSPSPDFPAYARQVVPTLKLPSGYNQFLKDNFLEVEVLPAGWDFMAVTFRGVGAETVLNFLYHYPSEAEARRDVDLVRRTLTETPRLSRRGQIWSDYITLESVEVRGTLLIAQARTNSRTLIGNALQSLDFWGFVPIRHK